MRVFSCRLRPSGTTCGTTLRAIGFLVLTASLAGMTAAAAGPATSAPPLPPSPWVATWGAAMLPSDNNAPDLSGQTLRQIVHVSVGGSQARAWFSNRYGQEPLHIGAAHLALSAQGSAVQPGTDNTLTFHHSPSVTIPPGATVVSDPVGLQIPAFANVVVSTYFPQMTVASTEHSLALQTSYASEGNLVSAATLPIDAAKEKAWYFLSGVDVNAPKDSAVVAFGDSITDGWRSTPNENRRWPDILATRLAATSNGTQTGLLGVVNAGISGNRVLLDGAGPNALSRFDSDVLARSNVRDLIILESINDIGRYTRDRQPYGDLLQRLEFGISEMAMQAHQHGIRVFGATLTPYANCGYASAQGEQVREGLNEWIRTTRVLDGFFDFDKATRDPAHPNQFLPKYDSDDHLHPNDAGYKAMADSIDLNVLTGAGAQK